jgi:hypothetical protein
MHEAVQVSGKLQLRDKSALHSCASARAGERSGDCRLIDPRSASRAVYPRV